MAWFKNTITKAVWEVEGEMEKRLRSDPEHIEVKGPKGKVLEPGPKPEPETMTNEEAQAAVDSGEAEIPAEAVVEAPQDEAQTEDKTNEPEPEKKPVQGKEKK